MSRSSENFRLICLLGGPLVSAIGGGALVMSSNFGKSAEFNPTSAVEIGVMVIGAIAMLYGLGILSWRKRI